MGIRLEANFQGFGRLTHPSDIKPTLFGRESTGTRGGANLLKERAQSERVAR